MAVWHTSAHQRDGTPACCCCRGAAGAAAAGAVVAACCCCAAGAGANAGPMATGSTGRRPGVGRGICSGGSPILRGRRGEELGRRQQRRSRHADGRPAHRPSICCGAAFAPRPHIHHHPQAGLTQHPSSHRNRLMKAAMASAVASGSSSCTACPACRQCAVGGGGGAGGSGVGRRGRACRAAAALPACAHGSSVQARTQAPAPDRQPTRLRQQHRLEPALHLPNRQRPVQPVGPHQHQHLGARRAGSSSSSVSVKLRGTEREGTAAGAALVGGLPSMLVPANTSAGHKEEGSPARPGQRVQQATTGRQGGWRRPPHQRRSAADRWIGWLIDWLNECTALELP